MANAFLSLNPNQTKRITDVKGFAESASAGHGLGGVLQYPLGLGGEYKPNWNAGSANDPLKTIPFTLFMPYKRSRGFDGLYSTLQNDALYTNMPSPDFAIALPTPPNALKTTYGVEYSEFEIGQAVGGALANKGEASMAAVSAAVGAFAGGAPGALLGALTGSKIAGSNLAQAAVIEFGKAAAEIATLGQAGAGTAQVFTGLADNPFSENVFKNVKFREHTFSYVFMPRNIDESKTIDDIISVFKYAMLPMPAIGSLYFEFPYEFQIVHSIQNTTFTLLPSVLQSMTVDFGGGTDSLKLFADVDKSGRNYPARITLEMSFKEMVLLNRNRVRRDFEIKDEGAPGTNSTNNSRDDSVIRFRF